MHYFDKENHMYGGHAIVGGHLPLATGMAFASRYRGEDRSTLCFFGDGAINQGAFHESLNLAALWQLPVVFVVEDNDWGISVPRAASTAVADNSVRAAAYGMPGIRVEDNAVEGVYSAAGEAVDRARSGGGPTLIEVHTLRLWGHFEGDAQGYRGDLEGVPGRDPIPTYETRLRADGVLDEDEISRIRTAAAAVRMRAISSSSSTPSVRSRAS